MSQVMERSTTAPSIDTRLVELQRALHEVPSVKIVDVLPASSEPIYFFRIILSDENFDSRQQVIDLVDAFHREFVEYISVEVYVSDWENAGRMLADC